MSEKIPCPNCLEPAEKSGNKIICQACDSTFVITKTGGAKVKEIGWKENIENRVKKIEENQAGPLGDVGDVGDDEPAVEDDADAEAEAEAEADFLPR